MDNILLGNRIKESRNARGYTVDDLAAAIGVNKSTISRYERGEIATPKLPVIESIGNELHVNPSWLVGKSQDKTFSSPNYSTRVYEPNHLFVPLKRMRTAMHYSPEEAAFEIGISKEDYLAIENGCNTDCITLAKIAMFYCCPADYALSFDGILNEDVRLHFLQHKLLRLHEAFGILSPEDQEKVISYANSLLNDVDFEGHGRCELTSCPAGHLKE